ncbi:MAG: hypothetical protein AABX65_02655, partial [Nanoarchaeota archaeon]
SPKDKRKVRPSSICCRPGEVAAYRYFLGKDNIPNKCCPKGRTHTSSGQFSDNFGISPFPKNIEYEIKEFCCPPDTEYAPSYADTKEPCQKKCCKEQSDCSESCEKEKYLYSDAFFIYRERCIEGYCRQKDYPDVIYPLEGEICKTIEKTKKDENENEIKVEGNCGQVKEAKIFCENDAACGSRCGIAENTPAVFERKCPAPGERGCVKESTEDAEKCKEDEVCIEHKKNNIINAKCEKCPKSLHFVEGNSFATEFDINDDYAIYIGQGRKVLNYQADNTIIINNAEEFIKRLNEICSKCPQGIDTVIYSNHGQPGRIGSLDSEKISKIGEKSPIKGCFKNFVSYGCSSGGGTIGSAFAE